MMSINFCLPFKDDVKKSNAVLWKYGNPVFLFHATHPSLSTPASLTSDPGKSECTQPKAEESVDPDPSADRARAIGATPAWAKSVWERARIGRYLSLYCWFRQLSISTRSHDIVDGCYATLYLLPYVYVDQQRAETMRPKKTRPATTTV